MKNIISIVPHDGRVAPNMGQEDASYFVRKLSGAAGADCHREIIQSIYKHGYEDGYARGRKYGKVIKLVNMQEI